MIIILLDIKIINRNTNHNHFSSDSIWIFMSFEKSQVLFHLSFYRVMNFCKKFKCLGNEEQYYKFSKQI